MKELEFSIEIKAPKEKVWFALWDDDTYRNGLPLFVKGVMLFPVGKKGQKYFSWIPNIMECLLWFMKTSLLNE